MFSCPSIPALLTTALISVLAPALADADQTAVTDLTITGDRPLTGFVWYPTADTALPTHLHGNAVWQGIKALPEARPAPGARPLVVLSHGMYGNAMNQSWLADALVARGYVVAAVNHPGTSTWDRDPDAARQMWERPRDLSRVIDHLTGAGWTGAQVDPARIHAVGHSLGGFTVMLLAGARFDAARLTAFCNGRDGDPACDAFALWQVAQTPKDRARLQADLSDPRVQAVAVLDLGGTQALALDSLAAFARPVLAYGAAESIDGTGLPLDSESRALVAALPPGLVSYHEPAGLAHFDFLGLCTPKALAILAAEEPDDVFVCKDGGADRQAHHNRIAAEVAAFFTP